MLSDHHKRLREDFEARRPGMAPKDVTRTRQDLLNKANSERALLRELHKKGEWKYDVVGGASGAGGLRAEG